MEDGDLLGTGYDEMMLANLAFITRPQDEIKDFDHAAAWAGLPEYERSGLPEKIIVSFENAKDRKEFGEKLGVPLTDRTKSIWFPHKENDDVKSVEFTDEKKT